MLYNDISLFMNDDDDDDDDDDDWLKGLFVKKIIDTSIPLDECQAMISIAYEKQRHSHPLTRAPRFIEKKIARYCYDRMLIFNCLPGKETIHKRNVQL